MLQFEPILDYKQSNIASGATPIGSAGRAPDRNDNQDFKITRELAAMPLLFEYFFTALVVPSTPRDKFDSQITSAVVTYLDATFTT